MADLARFREAQDAPVSVFRRLGGASGSVYETALAELRAGRKRSHWMWFIFPQLRALGRSTTAQRYGIEDIAEARAYLADPVLSARLKGVAEAVLLHPDRDPAAIMGDVDALKLRSSATLFREADGGAVFNDVIRAFYAGVPCPLTLDALGVS